MGTMQEAMAKLLRKPKKDTTEEKADVAKGGAEEIAKQLPKEVMPYDAVKRKRARLQQLDEETKE